MDWSKLIPTREIARYPKKEEELKNPWVVGLNFTGIELVGLKLKRDLVGFGIGIGLGRKDVWIGWPSPERASCPNHEDCEVKPTKQHPQP